MKRLNTYGEEFIQKVISEGRLEYINDYYQVDSVSVTQSQTNHLSFNPYSNGSSFFIKLQQQMNTTNRK